MKLTTVAATGGIGRHRSDGCGVWTVAVDLTRPDTRTLAAAVRDAVLSAPVGPVTGRIRPPDLADKPLTGTYRTAWNRDVRGGFCAPRADAAHHLLAMVNQPVTIEQAVGIAN